MVSTSVAGSIVDAHELIVETAALPALVIAAVAAGIDVGVEWHYCSFVRAVCREVDLKCGCSLYRLFLLRSI